MQEASDQEVHAHRDHVGSNEDGREVLHLKVSGGEQLQQLGGAIGAVLCVTGQLLQSCY